MTAATAVIALSTLSALAGPQAGIAAPLTAPSQTTQAVTEDQALAQAKASGQPVAVPKATSPTDALTANPDGSLTYTRTAVPTRKMVAGAWQNLDATLVQQTDGSIRTANTTSSLAVSPGGSGPLASLGDPGRSLDVTAPMTLPTPTLSGATATYANVLPGVDLQIRADRQGSMTQLFVIHDATAAANPALRKLAMGLTTEGVTVSEDSSQNLTAGDANGRPVFTAAAPLMWDSATPATTKAAHAATASTSSSPASAVHQAPVKVALSGSTIDLTPDQGMLTSSSTVYPIYVDPNWSVVGMSKSAWTTITDKYPTTKYYNTTPDPDGDMQAGYSGSPDYMTSRTLINFSLPESTLSGATIHSAEFDITENWAYSCTASQLNLYAPSSTVTSTNAYWNAWVNSMGSAITSTSVAHGYDSSCPNAGIGFNVTSTIAADVKAGRGTRTFGLAAADENSDNGWKEFETGTPSLTINYNHAPDTPTGLSTSPSTACAAATPTIVGDGNVNLYAPVSDRDRNNLGVSFVVSKGSTTIASSNPNTLTYPSGSTAVFVVPKATLESAAGSAQTTFTWRVQTTDYLASSGWSGSCSFTFDQSRPDHPTVNTPSGTQTIGQPVTVTIDPPTTGTAPTGYLWQLNGAAPQSVSATTTTITVTPNRYTNVVTVTPTSAGGNVGQSATGIIMATQPAQAADQDLTGDGIPDLLTVGGTSGLGAGLWVSTGQAGAGHTTGDGQIIPAASNLGANGDLVGTTGPASFTGAQVTAGTFTGSGFQDILAYYPTGTNAGTAAILSGNGDGSPIQSAINGNVVALPPPALSDDYQDNPIQLVNAGNTSASGNGLPDLLGITGDPSNGYVLAYYPNNGTVGGYTEWDLNNPTPTGGTDWNNWTLATAQTPSGRNLSSQLRQFLDFA